MDASDLYFTLSSSDSWSGYTIRDVKDALESGMLSWLPAESTDDNRKVFLDRHESQIDFLIYLLGLAVTLEKDDPSASIKELNRKWETKSLTYDSKARFRSVYENTYFYKFIHAVELQRLRTLVAVNDDGIINESQAVEYFITSLLFPTILDDHPGSFISYRDVDVVSENRAKKLDALRDALESALNANDLRGQFVQVFSLMTDYPWSVYRDIHNAMGYLLSFSKSEFNESFMSNLDRILENEGAAPIS